MQSSSLSYNQFLETIPDAAIVINPAGDIVLANSLACVLFGYLPGELQNQPIQTLVPETKRALHAKHIEDYLVSPQTRPMGTGRKLSAQRKDGSEFPTDIMLNPLHMDDALLTLCIVRDMSEQTRMETALRQSEEKYRHLVENASEVYYQVSLRDDPMRGHVEYVSRQTESIMGYSQSEFIQDPGLWLRSIHPDDVERTVESTHAILSSCTKGTREYRIWNTQRQEFRWVEDRVVPQADPEGNVIGYHGVARDITERKQREREFETIATISTVLRQADSRVEMLSIVLDELLTTLGADGAAFAMRDPANGETVVESVAGGFEAGGQRFAAGEGVSAHVILTGQPYLNNNARDDINFPRPDLLGNIRAVACVPLIAYEKTIGALWIGRVSGAITDHDMRLLNAIADMVANAIQRVTLHEQTQQDALELALAYDSTLEGWSHALDLRDKETEGHTLRVAEMTLRLVRAAGMGEDELVQIKRGALLHDIGKMGIPDMILHKPAELTDEEWEIMRKHPIYAYELLVPIDYLRQALEIPYCHHEKWDGSGYPRGLKGEQIPLAARLFAVADVWDALTSDRPYRKAWPKEKALEHLHEQAGKHFDPKAVELFLRVIDDKTFEQISP